MISIAEKRNLFHLFSLLWLLNKPAILLLFEELPLAASKWLWDWNLCIRCVLDTKLAKNRATVLAWNRASFLAPRAAYWRFFQYAALGAKSLWSMSPWSCQISYEGLGRLTCHSSFFGFFDLYFVLYRWYLFRLLLSLHAFRVYAIHSIYIQLGWVRRWLWWVSMCNSVRSKYLLVTYNLLSLLSFRV